MRQPTNEQSLHAKQKVLQVQVKVKLISRLRSSEVQVIKCFGQFLRLSTVRTRNTCKYADNWNDYYVCCA